MRRPYRVAEPGQRGIPFSTYAGAMRFAVRKACATGREVLITYLDSGGSKLPVASVSGSKVTVFRY